MHTCLCIITKINWLYPFGLCGIDHNHVCLAGTVHLYCVSLSLFFLLIFSYIFQNSACYCNNLVFKIFCQCSFFFSVLYGWSKCKLVLFLFNFIKTFYKSGILKASCLDELKKCFNKLKTKEKCTKVLIKLNIRSFKIQEGIYQHIYFYCVTSTVRAISAKLYWPLFGKWRRL
jgi:hypothetical protein